MFNKNTASKNLKTAAKNCGVKGDWKWEPCNAGRSVGDLPANMTAAVIHKNGEQYKITADELR